MTVDMEAVSQMLYEKSVVIIDAAIAEAVARERERLAVLADEVGATYPTCPCQPERGIGDPGHVGGSPAPFGTLIREGCDD